MNPQDWQPKTELAYGTGITGIAVVMHWLNDYVTPIATALGAVAGAVVGLHALYRLYKPKPRRNRRWSDNRSDDEEEGA